MRQTCSDAAAQELGLHHTYRLSSDSTQPLVFLIHGRAGNTSVMWTFARAIPESFSIISPQAPLPDPLGGYSWWNIEDPDPQGGILSAQSRLHDFMRKAAHYYQISPRATIGIGFSQGAGVLAALTIQQRELSGLALLAGFVVRNTHTGETPPATSLPPIFIAHGTQDEVIPVEKARAGKEYLESLGASVLMVEDPVGHKVGTAGMRALRKWLQQFVSSH